MANPAPMLNVPTTGSPAQAEIDISTFSGPLVLTISDNATLPPEGRVYAILGDPENPDLTGDEVRAGSYVQPPPPAEPDEGEFKQDKNLTVEISKAQLQKFAGRTVELRYQGTGESGLAYNSEHILLTIK
ncbi:hypothetical protein T3H00_12315 [Pseudomonas fluorescens]|jgi:hypothetical protein|uniref:hypothetical protein n=1 Tax=Pseudomonas TaxID=286 RepID=UPI001A936711|nr:MULTISPECIES: hypothetical protein [Pseudomonas]MDZ5433438.1 hypothetical protein [Pseudomonas fluorescens]